jgi:hypothetical protein
MAYFLWATELRDEKKCRSAKGQEKHGGLNDFLIFLSLPYFSYYFLLPSQWLFS